MTKRMTNTAAAQVVGKAVRGMVVSVPGDDERGVDGTWHVVGIGGRHPLDTETFASRTDAAKALEGFGV
ncbi:hypothetical protein WMF38_57370 [Sorangium sp. So ce118]